MSSINLSMIKGYESEKQEVNKLIKLLNNYDYYMNQGLTIPRGIIFQGPPGTGKTLFAKAIAGECNYKFFTAVADDLNENTLDVLKDVFIKAEKEVVDTEKPCLIYIDELDKLISMKSDGEFVDQAARENCRFLLQKLDQNDLKNKILVIASTNNYACLPKALLRSGRFDKKILIDNPDYDSRIQILKYFINNNKLFNDVNLNKVALRTKGLSCADLKTIINNVLLNCITSDKYVTLKDFDKCINELQFSSIAKVQKDKNTILLVLAHEVGHSIISGKLLGNYGSISGLQYGDTSGFVKITDKEENDDDHADKVNLNTFNDVFNNICIAFGGIAGENVFLKQNTVGVTSDLNLINGLLNVLERNGLCKFSYVYSRYNDYSKLRLKEEKQRKNITLKLYKKTVKILKKNIYLGFYLMEQVHNNNDVLSQEEVLMSVHNFEKNKHQIVKKYKKNKIKKYFLNSLN